MKWFWLKDCEASVLYHIPECLWGWGSHRFRLSFQLRFPYYQPSVKRLKFIQFKFTKTVIKLSIILLYHIFRQEFKNQPGSSSFGERHKSGVRFIKLLKFFPVFFLVRSSSCFAFLHVLKIPANFVLTSVSSLVAPSPCPQIEGPSSATRRNWALVLCHTHAVEWHNIKRQIELEGLRSRLECFHTWISYFRGVIMILHDVLHFVVSVFK